MARRNFKSPSDRLVEKQVDAAVKRALKVRQVAILDISKIYARAWTLTRRGATPDMLDVGLLTYIAHLQGEATPEVTQ